jgi:hypothetical protein
MSKSIEALTRFLAMTSGDYLRLEGYVYIKCQKNKELKKYIGQL